jgi:hypothetical protein
VSTLLMLTNFTYSLRKRLWLLRDLGQLPTWMSIHQFVGFIVPVAICFHATFQSNNLLATSTAASLGVLVVTGMIGRFAYGVVTDSEGRTVEHAEMQARWERHAPHRGDATPTASVQEPPSAATEPVDDTRLFRPWRSFRWRAFARGACVCVRNVTRAKSVQEFARAYPRLINSGQIGLFRSTSASFASGASARRASAVPSLHLPRNHCPVYFGYRWVF